MKIIETYVGALTNFEVLDFLRSRGAGKDPTRLIASIAPSEYKVYDYLEQTAASSQTRSTVNEFIKECKKYDLATAEIHNIINIRPASEAEIDPIIEECEKRFGENRDKLVETVIQMLPPPPTETENDERIDANKEETSDGLELAGSARQSRTLCSGCCCSRGPNLQKAHSYTTGHRKQ